MRRRCFLKLTGAFTGAVGAGAVAGLPAFAQAGPAAAAVILADISPATDAAALFAVLETFGAAGLAVTCAVHPPTDAPTAAPADPPGGFGALLADLAALGPAVEIALHLPGLATLSPHFQARAAFDAIARLDAILAAQRPPGVPPAPAVRTVLCDPAAAPTAPVGLRAAGVRNVVVRPEADAPVTSETWPNGVVRFFGGHRLAPWSAALPRRERANARLFHLSADSFAGVDEAALRGWAARLGEAILEAELAGEIAPMPVGELQWRDDYGFTRRLALRLVGDSPEVQEMAGLLARRGIPARVEAGPPAAGYWVAEPREGAAGKGATEPGVTEAGVTALGGLGCGAGGRLLVTPPDALPSGVAVLPVAGGSDGAPETGTIGLDPCAVLRLREIRLARRLAPGTPLIAPGAQEDALLTIEAGAVATPADRAALLAGIVAMAEDGITRFSGLGEMVNATISHDPIERRFRRTRAATLAPSPKPARRAEETAALMDDARRAWAFFERFTHPETGLCPATANVYTGGDALTWVTMWDVGSQINATVAAHRLGLIDAETLTAAARRILFQIAGRRSQGRLLPNGVIRTDRVRRGSSDFDGCDAGRLLAALDGLRRHSDLGEEIAALVASWDLDAIVIDGEIHSVRDGALHSTYASHCAHYAARAFARWGLEARSPYRTFEGRSRADGEMALLEAAARIGPLGAEPLLLEAVELGMSDESAYLADVLRVAQIEETEATGRLMAVSEMPIRRPPWFIYLGLQLGHAPREWAIDVVDGDETYRTRAFLDENMALSSKAAYLWAAHAPGAYADALVARIREAGRLPVGFASNVGQTDATEAAPFTDLNTNAVILQAIARILG